MNRHEILVEELIVEQQNFYFTNAVFKYGIDMLASMLLVWVESMALRAREDDGRVEKAIGLVKISLIR